MLIKPGMQWPPPGHQDMRMRWNAWGALWGGDLAELKMHVPAMAPGGYWARRQVKPGDREIHSALASDVARTSADLVAGDTPFMKWGDQAQKAVQDAWDEMAQELGWAMRLLEAAEISAALGGVYLRPAWDKSLANHPLLTVVRADQALPEFRFDILSSVTFVVELPSPNGWTRRGRTEVWRHMEHHEPGQIRNELWVGTTTHVGDLRPLTDHAATASFESVIDTTSFKPGILVEFVPNMLPQPLSMMPLGRSDYQGGTETLFDALDEAWASWMRDIDLGKSRILLSSEMLTPVAPSGGKGFFGRSSNTTPAKAFDKDQEAFVPLTIPAEEGGKSTPITLVQFAIRFAEHAATVLGLIEEIVSRCGYAPQTFGLNVDGQLSGTAMRRREHRSYRTRDKKRRYARPGLEKISLTLMMINHLVFGGPKPPKKPTLEWRETDQSDPVEAATVLELFRRAQAASTEVLVRMAHPEWDDIQVEEEVERVKGEYAAFMAPAPNELDHPEDNKPPAPKPPADEE